MSNAEGQSTLVHSEPAQMCVFCGGQIANRFSVRDLMFDSNWRGHAGTCDVCGSLKLLDPPDDLAPFYPAEYYSFATPELTKNGQKQPVHVRFRSVRALLWDYVLGFEDMAYEATRRTFPRREVHLLDVGCGSGTLLQKLALRGWTSLLGVDPFLSESEVVGQGYRVLRRTLSQVDGQFDGIMMHHSLEHTSDPRRELMEAAARLAPCGSCLVRVPVAGTPLASKYGAAWVGTDAPRHLAVPSVKGLTEAAEAAGLRIVRWWSDETPAHIWMSDERSCGIRSSSMESLGMSRGRGRLFTLFPKLLWLRVRSMTANSFKQGTTGVFVLKKSN